MNGDIASVETTLGIKLISIETAFNFTQQVLGDIQKYLADNLPHEKFKGVDVILGGSFARREATPGSDLDYLVLFDETPPHEAMVRFLKVLEDYLKVGRFKHPGAQGLFGDFDTAAQLLGRIGLAADSNINIARRCVLIFESVSVYDPALRENLIGKTLDRYCAGYDDRTDEDRIRVPRFLMNDLVRYWRTMAVDFGAKQWMDFTEDWYLRYAKLCISRKILFAGCLTSLFLTEATIQNENIPGKNQCERLKSHLKNHLLGKTPLARLLSCYEKIDEQSKLHLKNLFVAYDSFIGILLDTQKRELLKKGPKGDLSLWTDMLQLIAQVQNCLEYIFFEDPVFQPLTKRYGLF